jgi:hypothetical protein
MLPLKKIGFALVVLLSGSSLFAQTPRTVTPKTVAAKKYTPPKLTTIIGNTTDSATVSVDEALKLIAQPLRIFDDKKTGYSLTSYQFMYTRIGVTEDEGTGKVSPTTSMVDAMFKTTPLPELWQKNITEQLKPGESLFFFDVVGKDSQGHLYFAPNLKLKIR